MSEQQSGRVQRDAIVEVFDRFQIEGWVDAVGGTEPLTVSVNINEIPVQTAIGVPKAVRNSVREVQVFRFELKDFWEYARRGDRVSVRVDGTPIPIARVGMYWPCEDDGAKTMEEFKDRLDQGYVFDRFGELRLAKVKDLSWQKTVMSLYNRVRELVNLRLGVSQFLCYGTLLGAIRDQTVIGQDFDFDAAYISEHEDTSHVTRELLDIAFLLIDEEFRVVANQTGLSVSHPASGDATLDIYHLYKNGSGEVQFPFGVAGSGAILQSDLDGTREIDFLGSKALVPTNAEALVEHIYGSNWKIPDSGFSWDRDRVARGEEGLLTPEQIEEVYWASFYARTEYTSGSSFCEFIKQRDDLPDVVVDIGCGDGRDSYAFGAAGRKVVGLDRSHVGVRHATKKAEALGHTDVQFAACDVGDTAKLTGIVAAARERNGGGSILFYSRFFLHSIPAETQEDMMSALREASRPGDVFVAEFRTDKDEAKEKIHGQHFRRYQNGPAFGQSLKDRFGFEPYVEQQGTGFSPYKGEDPELYRVIARATESSQPGT